MITTVTDESVFHFRGKKTDLKPVNFIEGKSIDTSKYCYAKDPVSGVNIHIGNGSEYLDFDNCDVYIFDEENNVWVLL